MVSGCPRCQRKLPAVEPTPEAFAAVDFGACSQIASASRLPALYLSDGMSPSPRDGHLAASITTPKNKSTRRRIKITDD
eukprot:178561-Prorocentrum_minimum.AAC.9